MQSPSKMESLEVAKFWLGQPNVYQTKTFFAEQMHPNNFDKSFTITSNEEMIELQQLQDNVDETVKLNEDKVDRAIFPSDVNWSTNSSYWWVSGIKPRGPFERVCSDIRRRRDSGHWKRLYKFVPFSVNHCQLAPFEVFATHELVSSFELEWKFLIRNLKFRFSASLCLEKPAYRVFTVATATILGSVCPCK